MKRFVMTLPLLAARLIACPSHSPVDEIVESNIEARGGLERIQALQSIRKAGTASASGGRMARVVQEIKRALSRHLSTVAVSHHPQVAALFIHGPHFGDRYGIARTLTAALKNAGIRLRAMGCAVSSISVVVAAGDLAKAVQTLDATFQGAGTVQRPAIF